MQRELARGPRAQHLHRRRLADAGGQRRQERARGGHGLARPRNHDIARAQQRDRLRTEAITSILKTLEAFSHEEKLLIMGALANELESGRGAPPSPVRPSAGQVFKLPPKPVATASDAAPAA